MSWIDDALALSTNVEDRRNDPATTVWNTRDMLPRAEISRRLKETGQAYQQVEPPEALRMPSQDEMLQLIANQHADVNSMQLDNTTPRDSMFEALAKAIGRLPRDVARIGRGYGL